MIHAPPPDLKLKRSIRPLRDTFVGGALFLVPIGVAIFVLARIFKIVIDIITPVIAVLPVETVGGIALVNIAAVLLMVLVCMFAGKAARSRIGKRLSRGMEEKIHFIFPRYSFVKSMAGAMAGADHTIELDPIIVRLDDSSQIAFEVERLSSGGIVVYLPGAPDPWSGSVVLVTEDRVSPLNREFTDVIRTLKQAGRGTAEVLDGESGLFYGEGRPL